MSTQLLCDRCGAGAIPPSASRVFLVPLTSPGTKPVAVETSVTLTLTLAGQDLCPVCLASALTEYVRQPAGAAITVAQAQALGARVTTVLGLTP